MNNTTNQHTFNIFHICNYKVIKETIKIILCISIIITNCVSYAFTIENEVKDGTLIRGTLKNNEQLWINGQRVHKNPNGIFYFGIPQNENKIKIRIKRTFNDTDYNDMNEFFRN